MTFSPAPDSPDHLRVEMFARKTSKDEEPETFDVGWAESFAGDNSCTFKTLAVVHKETGLDFSLLKVTGDFETLHVIPQCTTRDLVFLHSISRFWAMKNGLIDKIKIMDREYAELKETAQSASPIYYEKIKPEEESVSASENEAVRHTKRLNKKLTKKIRRLEKMSLKLLKQNATIYKTLQKRGGGRSLIDRLLGR